MYDDNHRPGNSKMRSELRHIIGAWCEQSFPQGIEASFAAMDQQKSDAFYDEAAELIFALVDTLNEVVVPIEIEGQLGMPL